MLESLLFISKIYDSFSLASAYSVGRELWEYSLSHMVSKKRHQG